MWSRKLLCELSKLSKCNAFNLLGGLDTIRTLMHLFLFTNSAQRALVSICTQHYSFCWSRYFHLLMDSAYLSGRVYASAVNFPCIITLVLPLKTKKPTKTTISSVILIRLRFQVYSSERSIVNVVRRVTWIYSYGYTPFNCLFFILFWTFS